MAKNTKPKNNKKNISTSNLSLEITCIISICISILLILSVFFNSGGFIGKFFSKILKGLFGVGAYILPFFIITCCLIVFFSEKKKINILKFTLSLTIIVLIMSFIHLVTKDNLNSISYSSYILNIYKNGNVFNGGVVGALIGDLLTSILGKTFTYILIIFIIVACTILLSEKSFFKVVEKGVKKVSTLFYYENNISVDEEDEDLNEYELDPENRENVLKKAFVTIKNKIKDIKYSLAKKDVESPKIENAPDLNISEELEPLEPLQEIVYAQNQVKPEKIALKKIDNYIFDGTNKYKKVPKPTIINLKQNSENKPDKKISLAIDEINKSRETSNKNNYSKQQKNINKDIPSFLKSNVNQVIENNTEDSLFNIKQKENNVYKDIPVKSSTANLSPAPEIVYYNEQPAEQIFERPAEQTFEQLSEQTSEQTKQYNEYKQNFFSQAEQLEKAKNVFNEKTFNLFKNKSPLETIISSEVILDYDIPTHIEIEQLFSKPPEHFLSEETDFSNLDKLNEFYDFEKNISEDIKNNVEVSFEASTNLTENDTLQETQENVPFYSIDEDVYNKNDEYIEEVAEEEDVQDENIAKDINENIEKIEILEDNSISQNIVKKDLENTTYEQNLNYTENANINSNQNTNNFVQKNQPHIEPYIERAEKQKFVNELQLDEKAKNLSYEFPKLEFLSKNDNLQDENNDIELRENSSTLVKTLKSFNVNSEVIKISKGPSVTRYELSIEDGIKVSKILGLDANLALSLAATSIRIEAPIPGKSAVGIEIPNKEVKSVFLSEVICDEKFQKFNSKVSFGIGKDITGNVIVTDIAKMPHMLIAGATGSGKSVCINTLITSILYKASPKEVRLIMIDPKVVELSVYNGIPHLLLPVVTEPEKASGTLNWAVQEMMDRYNLFAQTGVRNIAGYNNIMEQNGQEKLPQIVIIIDELADLMMVAAKEVENAICRLAQLARAAGMHLIIATQRPSVDVITGLIKANIPSRIAFAVSSGTDSRTVLDSVGAEKLLGKGDMLFKSVDMSKPLRIQGAFISDKEVETIVDFIKSNSEPNYDQSIINKIDSSTRSSEGGSELSDELTEEVIAFLVRKGKASTSLLQRQFRIGYNRAARIIEELEDRGIISSENGSKQRDVLMDRYQFEEYMSRQNDY